MVSFAIQFTVPIATFLAVLFAFLGLVHVYWAMGGKIGLAAAIPEVKNKPAIMPGKPATLGVALVLFGFGTVAILLGLGDAPTPTMEVIGWVVAGIFLLRAIGEFRYVGFFKKVRHTTFGYWDTVLFSPLCLLIAALFALLLTL